MATGNPHKVEEIRAILGPTGLVVRSLDEVGGPFPEPEETGRTFEANARIKALAYAWATARAVLADDSGLEVDALGGEPGVDSAIWAGAHGGRAERDARNNAKLAERMRGIYDALVERGYAEYGAISSRNADGYHGWEEEAPFDKIIVTCGIDHIPPPLLRQLRNGGTMVIPVGPPGAQRVLKVVKEVGPDGAVRATRSDIYGGRIVPFVPFTKLEGGVIKGTHNK